MIGVKIDREGKIEEIYNGPGSVIKNKLKNRQVTKTNLHSISISTLRTLNGKIPKVKRIPERGKKID